jgi:outer membrane protein OmpA-like peptidoglycan-associated protein
MSRIAVMLAGLLFTPAMATWWQYAAAARLQEAQAVATEAPQAAVASSADEGYCTPELKKILRRVLQSCGLAGAAGGRGCQPTDAKSVAALSGSDFNALFDPLANRAGILQFDQDKSELDPDDTLLLDKLFADQRGASWFFVVSRSSPEGSVEHNRQLSEARGNAVLTHLREKFDDAGPRQGGRPAVARRGVRPARHRLLQLDPQRRGRLQPRRPQPQRVRRVDRLPAVSRRSPAAALAPRPSRAAPTASPRR